MWGFLCYHQEMNVLGYPLLIAMAVTALAITCIPFTWKYFATHLTTLLHESGHAIVGLLTGAGVKSITIHMDSSGETITLRTKRLLPLGMILTSLAGYPMPLLLGMLLLTSSFHPWQNYVLWGFIGLGLLCLICIRNLFGALVSLAFTLSFTALTFLATPLVTLYITTGLGMLFLMGGARDVFSLTKIYIKGGETQTDLSILRQATSLPQIFWLLTIIGLSLGLPYALFPLFPAR